MKTKVSSTKCIARALFLTAAFAIGSAFAGPAYRAGWSGGYNLNGGQWNFDSDSDVNKPAELGVFTGPIAATNSLPAYIWGLEGFWVPQGSWYPRTCWGGYRLWRYVGQMYFDGSQYYFGEDTNVGMAFYLDGTKVWVDNSENTFTTRTVTPSAGWHDVELRLASGASNPAGAHVKGAEGFLLGFGYVKTTVAPTGMSAFYYPKDAGTGEFLRNVVPEGFITLNSLSVGDGVYSFSVTATDALPSGAKVTAYLGDANSVAENGREGTWIASGTAVSIAAGQTVTVSAPWDSDDIPYYSVKVSGTMYSIDWGFVNGDDKAGAPIQAGPQMAFWQWTDVGRCELVPTIEADFSGLSGTTASFDVDIGWKTVIEGLSPDVTVTAYYGATDAGATAEGWTSKYNLGDMPVGSYKLDVPNLVDGASYIFRFAAQLGDDDPVWSDPMAVSLAGITLSNVPEAVYENYAVANTFKVVRPASASDSAVTVNLSYSGEGVAKVTTLPEAVSFAVGEVEKIVSFKTIDNEEVDGNVELRITIEASSQYVVGGTSTATVIVYDDETEGQVVTWVGGGGNFEWTNPANWDKNRVPGVMDTANFVYNGAFDGGDSVRGITLAGTACVKSLKVATGDVLTITDAGGAMLQVGGIDRGTAGWPWGALNLEIPVGIFDNATGTNTWNSGSTDIVVKNNISFVGDAIVLRKVGSGKLSFSKADQTFAGVVHCVAGELAFTASQSTARGGIAIGGEDTSAKLTSTALGTAFKNSNITLNVYTNGLVAFPADGSVSGFGHVNIYAGGNVQIPYFDTPDITLYAGGQFNMAGGWSGVFRPGKNGTFATVKSGDVPAYLNVKTGIQVWNNADITVEDGAAAVDLVMNIITDEDYGGGRVNPYVWTKSGAGTMKTIGISATNQWPLTSTKRSFTVKAGTALADNPVDSFARGGVTVNSGATLGGIGRIYSSEIPNQTSVTVNGTLAPGSIDTLTGNTIFGTLTVGATDMIGGVEMNSGSKMKIKFGPARVSDKLEVYGPLNISGSNTELILDADDLEGLKGGEYVIASATGGIKGTFGKVTVPEGVKWRVSYRQNEIVAMLPLPGFSIRVK